MVNPDRDAEPDPWADLTRLLREGLVTVGWDHVDAPARFAVTPAGRAYLAETADTAVRVHVRITDVGDARSPRVNLPHGDDREKGSSS